MVQPAKIPSSPKGALCLGTGPSWVSLRRYLPRSAALPTERGYDVRRARFGDDYPDTLTSAVNLAIRLGELGEHAQARALDEDTLARRRRVLGEDHPDTLHSTNNLAIRLAALGEHAQARTLAEDTLARSRRVAGEDHAATRKAVEIVEWLERLGSARS